MPTPTDHLTTPVDPVDPNLAHIDVASLVKEVTGDLVATADAMIAAQAQATTAYTAYHEATTATDDEYNALLAAQELARTVLFTANSDRVTVVHTAYLTADAAKKAAEASFQTEIDYVVQLAGGEPEAIDPTPHAAPMPTTSTTTPAPEFTTTTPAPDFTSTTTPDPDATSTTPVPL